MTMKKLGISTVAFVLALAVAAPAFASAVGHTGHDYGQHHADHARMKGGFSGAMNPGVVHRGFSGWHEHMPDMHD
jgi:hypothetical protein